ncbi:MAG: hypothetical protein MJZ54_01525 [Bacteroidaceae bacterium]|nr:hypothetical protein [Bacteroidaceae bacterium]
MRKIYNLLALVMLFTIAGSAQAIYWEQTGDDPVLEPQEGVAYFLGVGSASDMYAANYLNSEAGVTKTNASGDKDVWYFEAATDGKWKIYHMENGVKTYLSKASSFNDNQGFTTTVPSRINEFTIVEASYAANAEEAEEMELTYWTSLENLDGTQVLIVDANGTSYLASNGTTCGYNGGPNNANTWRLIPAQEMPGTNYLDAVINELFPDGFDPDGYSVGINPGDYSEDALNTLVEAYENANAGSGDDAECIQLAEDLIKALKALQDSFVPFQAGYYVFTSARDVIGGALYDNTDNIDGDTDSSYAGRTVNGLKWCYSSSHPGDNANHTFIYNGELEGDEWCSQVGLAYMVWQVIDTPTKNRYYFRNWRTGNYIHVIDTNNKQVPVVKEPTQIDLYTMEPNPAYPGLWCFFNDNNWVKNNEVSGIHASGDYANTVAWPKSTEGSCWSIRTVTEEELARITELEKQPLLNQTLKKLVDEVENAIASDINHAIAANGVFDPAIYQVAKVDGILTDPSQLNSATPDAAEGTIEMLGSLLDSDYDTFWHSNWHAADVVRDDEGVAIRHDLEIDLGKVCEAVTVKMSTRVNGGGFNTAGAPRVLSIYGSNDGEEWTPINVVEEVETGEYDEESGEPIMEEKGGITVQWDGSNRGTDLEGVEHNTRVGFFTTPLGYSHLRFDVIHSGSNNNQVTGDYYDQVNNTETPYFNLSEIRVYDGDLKYEIAENKENSKYYAVSEEVRKQINDLIEVAKTELEDELATQETIDALKAAFEAYKAQRPDAEAVQALVNEAKAQANAAEEGDGVGYFAVGAGAELLAVANSINVNGSSSIEECNAAMDKIKAAIAAFNAKLNKPVNGKYYYVKSATSAGEKWFNGLAEENQTEENENNKVAYYADNDFIGTRAGNPFNVAWGAEALADDIEDYLGYVWQSETNADGTFSLKHVLTGYYMGGYEENNEDVQLVPADQKGKFTYQSAKVAGVVNIVFAEGIYLNAQPGTNNVVTWNSASELDNSALSFEEAEAITAGGDYIIDLDSDHGLRVMTLPVAVTIPAKGTVAYEVLGLKQAGETYTIELKKLTGAVAAGKPFIFDPDGFAEAAFEGVQFGAVAESQNANGLQGVLVSTELNQDGFLVLSGENAVLADKGQRVAAGRGFFTKDMKSTTETGDLTIACPDGVPAAFITGIESIIIRSAGKASFDLQGRRVQNTEKGLYIINGQKVVVK